MNGTAADRFNQALDRRLTEGLNLLHGRLDVLHEDVRENRKDIKELRKELWGGLKEGVAERARLATKTDVAALEESQNRFRAEVAARFAALEESQNQFRAEVAARFAALEESQNQFRAEVAARFTGLEESNRQVLAIVSRTQERSEATAWTRRQVLVAVAAGISLLIVGALLQPLLERTVAALFGG